MDRSAVRAALVQLEDLGLIVREIGKRPWVRSKQTQGVQTPGSQTPGSQTPGSQTLVTQTVVSPALPQKSRTKAGSPVSARSGPVARMRSTATGLQTIAAILPQHPIYTASLAIMHGINATLRSAEAPFRLQVIDTHGGSESRETCLERLALDSVLQENIAGVVLWHMGGAETLPQLQEIERRGIPVVFVDRFPPELTCDFVGSDNYAGIEAAMDYLRQDRPSPHRAPDHG